MNLQKSLNFLTELEQNNNRDWFTKNKEKYVEAKQEFEFFVELLIPKIKEIDKEIDVFHAKECLFRIYRDVRFSKDKRPYKTNFGAYIAKGGRKSQLAGYYFHLEPNASFIGGGIYMPQSKELKAIRTDIFENPAHFKEIINNKEFKKYFPEIYGEKLKTAPRGFPKDFEDIDLLRHKSYAGVHKLDNSIYKSDTIIDYFMKVFKIQYTFNQFLNETIK